MTQWHLNKGKWDLFSVRWFNQWFRLDVGCLHFCLKTVLLVGVAVLIQYNYHF